MAENFDLKPTREKLRSFIFSLFAVAFIFALIFLIFGRQTMAIIIGCISAYSLLSALIYPPIGYLIYYPWILLGWLLAHTISPLIIGLIYYIVVTPTGLIMRLTGRDRLILKKRPPDQTYWHNSNKFEKDDFERMF
jgi:hypothetical protein